jgi:hypothetical protein
VPEVSKDHRAFQTMGTTPITEKPNLPHLLSSWNRFQFKACDDECLVFVLVSCGYIRLS